MRAVKKRTEAWLFTSILLSLTVLPVAAEAPPPPPQPDTTSQTPEASSAPVFAYRPPNRGAPARRLGGGTRAIAHLSVLAPDHTAVTTQAQPRLYWYLSPGFSNNTRFRLSASGAARPLLEIVLPPQPNGGIQRLDLAVLNIRLEPGNLYEWGVMLDPQPHQRWPALKSLASIAVDEPDATLEDAAPEQRPYLAAQRGYWYDALDGISRLAEADPTNPVWHLQRAALLEQGGLLPAATYERERAQSGQ